VIVIVFDITCVQIYSLSRIVGHLFLLENEAHREEVMCAALRKLIPRVKVQHAKYWIHEGTIFRFLSSITPFIEYSRDSFYILNTFKYVQIDISR